MAKREVVGFRIDKRLAKLLKLYAVEKERRYNEVVEEAILEYLEKRGVEVADELKVEGLNPLHNPPNQLNVKEFHIVRNSTTHNVITVKALIPVNQLNFNNVFKKTSE